MVFLRSVYHIQGRQGRRGDRGEVRWGDVERRAEKERKNDDQ
jgi:Ser-tRNA(Ala) deacylase AlaX